jgi:signal transduction histidine kinase
MRISIRVRTILVMNLLVIGMAIVLGRIAGQVAGGVVEERLAGELVRNTSRFLEERNLPLTDDLMRYLGQIFGADVAAMGPDGAVLASSLAPAQTEELRRQIGRSGAGVVTIGGEEFRVDSQEVLRKDSTTGVARRVKLCLAVPRRQFLEARDKATERMTLLALPAVGVATVLAFALSVTITGPIRKLAAQADRLAEDASAQNVIGAADGKSAGTGLAIKRGPGEVVRLAESFDHLLESLRTAQGQLAQSQRLALLGGIAASVAHELRNPLSGIKMNVRVLRDQLPQAGEADESLRVILREIDRMDLYLEELLGLAKDPSARKAAAGGPQPVRLEEVADSVGLLLEGRFRHEGVEVVREFALVPPVAAEENQVRQVVMNLLINAIEAMPGGGTIRLGLRAAGEGFVHFSVADAGRGVAKEIAADIFEPFVTTKPGSAGLGLHLCRRIITEHGGRIGHDSLNHGTVFWFELPAYRGPNGAGGDTR